MTLPQHKIEELVALVQLKYPGWSGFDDSRFVEDETGYKRAAIAEASKSLSEAELERLYAEGRFDEIIDRLDASGKSTNLLWMSVPRQGDLGILYQPELDRPSFCEALIDLLYGPGSSHSRLERHVEYVDTHGLRNKWVFPTYFLFICHPDTEMLVKPRTTQWFLEFMGGPKFTAGPAVPSLYAAVKELAHELRDAMRPYGARDMVDVQSMIWVCASVVQESSKRLVSRAKRTEFAKLFQDFAETYPDTPEGQYHIELYEPSRMQGKRSFDKVVDAFERGEDITQRVLLELLPYTDTESNRAKGAWVHVAPSITGDIQTWFGRLGWTQQEDWPKIALAILGFVRRCSEDPEQLAVACQEFSDLPKSKGFQTGMLTPILNALRPDEFVLVNNKSRQVVNYLADTAYSQKLTDYPAINATERQLIQELTDEMEHPAVAMLSQDDRFDMFCHWLVAVKKHSLRPVSYWKIAPGEDAWNWDACREGGFIAIGWEELGDLSGMSRKEFETRAEQLIAKYPDWSRQGIEQVWRFAREIKEGDRVVANHGISEVLGTGTVVGEYEYTPSVRHGHRLPVEWDDLTRRAVNQQGWRRTLVKLRESTFRKVSTAPEIDKPIVIRDPGVTYIPDVEAAEGCPFSKRTFELLAGLHDTPTKAFYQAHKDEFSAHLIGPFKQLVREVAARLPEPIAETMETEKRLFSRILKNDWGQGGAWDFYWGAFYPKGGKRTEDAQLSLWINYERLEVGFYIGSYGPTSRDRFSRNCQDHYSTLTNILKDALSDERIFYSRLDDTRVLPDGSVTTRASIPWQDWLRSPEQADFDASYVLSRDRVLQLSRTELQDEILEMYGRLFPLVLLAALDDPIPAIVDYLEPEEDVEPVPVTNPVYTLDQCAGNTGFEQELLDRWVRAVERKGQAILYGPPGTGKTYVAEHLAKHLVGGGDGFVELVQFHPAYAYEDFMQGIRPQERKDGGLSYPTVPGRFLQFCEKASQRQGCCVLIIDEINRANLARVFGEMMYLLEYRDQEIPLAGGSSFSIPENVRIIGTMNTADRSIALVDHALRRRFAFLRLGPNYGILKHYHQQTGFDVGPLVGVLGKLNRQIGDPHYEVGITFFLQENLADQVEDIWQMEVEPYLEEYFFDQPDKVDEFRWKQVGKEILGTP